MKYVCPKSNMCGNFECVHYYPHNHQQNECAKTYCSSLNQKYTYSESHPGGCVPYCVQEDFIQEGDFQI